MYLEAVFLNSMKIVEINSFIYVAFQASSNVSIMDQLNRGVKVEGLMLPPGITLTRVDPMLAEGLRAKKESISRVSFYFVAVQQETSVLIEIVCCISDYSASSGTISTAVRISTTPTIHNWNADAIKWINYG